MTFQMPDFTGHIIRGYEIQGVLGTGMSATVYRAFQPTIGRYVALKVVPVRWKQEADFSARFNAEARLIAQLEHPNIIPLYEFWQDETHAFLAMRLVRGGTLESLLAQHGQLSLAQVVRTVEQIADALAAAHESGIIHRDLKPSNILIDERGNTYLSDFGIAGQVSSDALQDDTGTAVLGTIAYVSPEQITGQPLTPQSDIYSLGLILYEMLAGRHPYEHEGLIDFKPWLDAHLRMSLPPLSSARADLPNQLDSVVRRAAAKAPAHRYTTVLELAADVRRLYAEHIIRLASSNAALPARQNAAAPEHRNREFMLQSVYAFWIDGVLRNSLHNTLAIELQLQETPLAHPWELQVVSTTKPVPNGLRIVDIFDRLNGKLLILGSPGSGKTTTLLELARDLLVRATNDGKHPIPIIFNLSSWSKERKPIEDWLVDELNDKYQMPKRIGRDWVVDDELLLLLDGLDEVNPDLRDSCVEALNTYREQHSYVDIVVCSRLADYQQLSNDLRLNGAVLIASLSDDQIDHYLTRLGPNAGELRRLLTTDTALHDLSRSPFMLSILALTYGDRVAVNALRSISTDALRRTIFGTYVDRVLTRRRGSAPYTADETVQYLAWLACQMQEHAQSLFQIEDLQSTWLTEYQRPRYYRHAQLYFVIVMSILLGGWRVIDGVIQDVPLFWYGTLAVIAGALWGWMLSRQPFRHTFIAALPGILLGIAWGLAVGERDGTTAGLVSGVISVFVNSGILVTNAYLLARTGNHRDHILPVQKLRFSLRHINLLAIAATGAIAAGYYLPKQWTPPFIIASIFSAVSVTAIAFFASGLVADKVEQTTYPNQGMRRSLRFGLTIGLLISFAAFISAVLQAFVLPHEATQKIADGVTSAITIGSGAFFSYGLYPVIHHFWLRYVLWKDGMIPRNYAGFLDHAAQLTLMHKVGSGYIFIHRYLLEYFASLHDEPPTRELLP